MASTYQDLRKKINQNKQDLAEIEKYLKEGEVLEKDIGKNAYQIEDRVKKIEQKIEKLKGLKDLADTLEMIKEFAQEKKKLLEQPKQKLKAYLGAELDRKLREKGLSIQGNLPELRVGVLTMEFLLSESQVKIWYGPKVEPLGKTDLVTDEVVDAVMEAYKELDEAGFQDEQTFLKLILDSYSSLIKRNGMDFGAGIPIISWLGEVAWNKQDTKFLADPRREHFKSYSRTQFSYDLSRLKQRKYGTFEIKLVVAAREQTKKREDNLWIPNTPRGEGTHFAAVIFRQRLDD